MHARVQGCSEVSAIAGDDNNFVDKRVKFGPLGDTEIHGSQC